MRFFHLGLAHLPLTKTFQSCAFTQKLIKMNRMLLSLGHEVYAFGCRAVDEPPIEDYYQSERFHFIETHSLRDVAKDYGEGYNLPDGNGLNYPWRTTDFRHDFNAERKPSTLKFYAKCIEYINRIKKPDDFLLITQGSYHKPIDDAVKLYLTCEPGVGYRGSYCRFRAFESSYIQNFSYGSRYPYECINGNYYDRVIPNYFDPEDFEFSSEKEDYYLYIGRMIRRKGILTAIMTCNAIGKKLILVGQGATVQGGKLIAQDFTAEPGTWEYQGFADAEKRKKLMSKAIATFTPTEYLECFAGTHVESMISGTPPITTNFGVFPETIPSVLMGKVGFRCNTLQDFVDAAIKARDVNHEEVRRYGERFLMDNVKWEYEKWFSDMYAVWESTDGKRKGWHRLNVR